MPRIHTTNGVTYIRAPTKRMRTGHPTTRRVRRTVWWRYKLAGEYTFEFADEFGLSLRADPQGTHNPQALYTITETTLTAREGFKWDGASGPVLQTKNSIRATLVHDIMCEAIADGAFLPSSRANADLILLELLLADGMSKYRANAWYTVVDAFG